VEFAEPNGYLHAFPNDPNDPYDNTACYNSSDGACVTQWARAKLNAYAAWDVTTGSPSVRVAVVDTGIDVGDPANLDYTGHEDMVSGQTPIVKSFVSGETGNDDNGHGTHVAGTIGACTTTRAWRCWPVRRGTRARRRRPIRPRTRTASPWPLPTKTTPRRTSRTTGRAGWTSPHVAGVTALVWARGQCTTNGCVRGKIESTADPVPGTGTYWKYGRVNYYNAVN
jgi:subtilisin family serine protease